MFLTDAFFWRFGTGFTLLAIALFLIWFLRHSVRRAAESTDWPIVEGSVIGSSLKVIQDSNQHRFRPLVEYAYSVDGKDYRCSRIQWGGLVDLPSRSAAAKVTAHYRSGKAVKVYYDPGKPAVAVLQPGHTGGIGNIVIIAPLFALFGLFYVGFAFLG